MGRKVDRRQSVQSVEVGMHVLKCLAAAGRGASLAALAREAELPPAKLHRYLVALISSGYAAQDQDTGRYMLGPEALATGLAALAQVDVVTIAGRALAQFADAMNESCFLAVWGNCGPTIVRWQESTRPVTVNVRVGSVMPLLSSATGHVFYAWARHDALGPMARRELADTKRRSPGGAMRSQADLDQFRQNIRKQGFATVDGVMLPGVSAASAPIFDSQGELVAAITTLGPSGHIDLSVKGPILRALLERAHGISRQLGWRTAS